MGNNCLEEKKREMEKRRETMIELKKIKRKGGIRENRRMYRENKKRLRHSNIKKGKNERKGDNGEGKQEISNK